MKQPKKELRKKDYNTFITPIYNRLDKIYPNGYFNNNEINPVIKDKMLDFDIRNIFNEDDFFSDKNFPDNYDYIKEASKKVLQLSDEELKNAIEKDYSKANIINFWKFLPRNVSIVDALKYKNNYEKNRKNNKIFEMGGNINKKKYAYGGQPIKIQDPSEAILRGQQNVINAELDAERRSKGWRIAGDILSSTGNKILNSMGVPGADMLNNVTGLSRGLATGDLDFADFGKGILSTGLDFSLNKLKTKKLPIMSMGGNISNQNIPIEAEGQELIETPDGQLGEIQGPSHEEGGVPMEVPQDSVIYSKRLKGPDGQSMAKRKEFREKHLAKLEKLVKLNPNDKILKRTYEKTLKDFEKQEQEDVEYMDYMNEISNSQQEISQDDLPLEDDEMLEDELPIMATGGKLKRVNNPVEIVKTPQLATPKFNLQTIEDSIYIGKPFTMYENNTSENETVDNKPLDNSNTSENKNDDTYFGDIFPYTTGDLLSMYGMYKSGTDPLKLTQQQRAGDTPNINYYEDYGKKGLQRLEETKDFVTGQHNKNLVDLITERDTSIARNRANARGINTQRALDLATDIQNYKAQNNAHMNYLSQINQIMGMEANVLNQIDQMVMKGEEKKDLTDRQDRDNYYTQLQRDTRYKNKMLQSMGQFLNNVKERQHTENMINSYSDKYVYKNGVIVGLKKGVEDPEFQYWKGATRGQQDIWNKAVSEKGYKFEDGVFYNNKGEEVDHLDKNLKVKVGGRKNNKIVEETKKNADIVRNLYKNVFDGTDYTDEEVLEILNNKDKFSTIKLKSGREVNMQDIDIDNSFDKDIEEYVTSNGKRKISNGEYINRVLKGEDLSGLIPVKSSDYYEEYKPGTFNGKVKIYVKDQNGERQKDKNGKEMTKEVTYSNEKLNLVFKKLAKIYKEETGEKFNPNNLNKETLEKVGKILKIDEKLTKDDLIKILLNIE